MNCETNKSNGQRKGVCEARWTSFTKELLISHSLGIVVL